MDCHRILPTARSWKCSPRRSGRLARHLYLNDKLQLVKAASMVHTHSLQGGWAGCGCQQLPAGGKPFCGSQLHRRRSTGSVKFITQTQCSSTVANVKLPATHKEASQRALDQLRASSSIVNSKQLSAPHSNTSIWPFCPSASAVWVASLVACYWPQFSAGFSVLL